MNGKSDYVCRICGESGRFSTFLGREMMFGTKEEFEYFQCGSCDCLQISEIPLNLGRYYPPNYYSLKPKKSRSYGWLERLLLKERFRNAIFNRGYRLNKVLQSFTRMPDLRVDKNIPVVELLKRADVKSFSARFLDVGCGTRSAWLLNLQTMGFKNLFGVDPFIDQEVRDNNIVIHKNQLSELSGSFDVITFHHSLEHIPDQIDALRRVSQLLNPGGTIIIRIPTVSSYAWRHYGTNWVEMDPPRHLFLHSKKSIKRLGEVAGLWLHSSACDSLAFEFYGSEQYLRGIPLTDEKSYWKNENTDIFTTDEIQAFMRLAERVNKNGECGRACFFFKHTNAHRGVVPTM